MYRIKGRAKGLFLIRRLDNLLSSIIKVITACVLCIQVAIIFLGVIFRYFLNSPLTWVDELTCYLLVFTTFMGGYVALKENKLARIGFLLDKMPGWLKKALIILADAAVLIFVAAIAWYGIKLGGMPTILNQRTPSMGIPMICFYFFIPLSGTLMSIHMVVRTVDAFFGKGLDVQGEEEQVV